MNAIDHLEFLILRRLFPAGIPDGPEFPGWHKSKLTLQLGGDFPRRIAGKTVIDFGCGKGAEAVELANLGAGEVIGIDIREEVLVYARRRAQEAGVSDRCQFVTATNRRADIIVSVDAFEHFDEPAGVLSAMDALLKPDGEVVISFGPTWYHPMGGHLFSVFPWAHLLFSEKALIRWRSTFKTDGATRFGEVAGGLNQMTIRRFERLVENSPLRFASLDTVPIRQARPLHNRLTREFLTAVVRCRLVKRVRR